MAINTWDAANSLGGSLGTLSNANHTSTVNGALNATTDHFGTSGKYYIEAQITTLTFTNVGIATSTYVGASSGGTDVRGFYANGGSGIGLGPGGSLGSAGANSPNTVNDYVTWAIDVPSLKVWLGRIRAGSRVWIGGGDPAAGTTPTFSASGGGGSLDATLTTLSGWYPYHSSGNAGNDVVVINCGDSAFNVAPPAGFTAFKAPGARPIFTKPLRFFKKPF